MILKGTDGFPRQVQIILDSIFAGKSRTILALFPVQEAERLVNSTDSHPYTLVFIGIKQSPEKVTAPRL